MAKKLKRFFSMLLAVSMIMSQVSVAAFAEELHIATNSNAEILSSDTRGGYLVSSGSNSEYEPQTGSNASSENESESEPETQPMMFKMFRRLPDTVEVTDLQLISVVDGTPSFDADNEPGHDDGQNNGIVRTLDTVTYNLRMAIQEPVNPTRTNETDKIQFMTVIPKVTDQNVQILVDAMDWLYDSQIDISDDGLVLTGYTIVDSEVNDSFWQDIHVSLKVYDMENKSTFTPQFYAWVEGQAVKMTLNEEEDTTITVSAKEAINIGIDFVSDTKEGYFDIPVKDSLENIYGSIFGLTLRLELLSDSNDLKGVVIPKEEISFDLELNLKSVSNENGIDLTRTYMPRLIDYTQVRNGYESHGKRGYKMDAEIKCNKLLPFGEYNKEHPDRCVYDSGDISITQDSLNENILHVEVSGYKFAKEIMFPEKTQNGQMYSQSTNRGAFSVAYIQLFVPHENTSESRLYTLSAEVESEKIKVDDQKVQSLIQTDFNDDVATRQIQTISGAWNQYVIYAHQNDLIVEEDHIKVGNRAWASLTQGDVYAYPGEELYLIGSHSNKCLGVYSSGIDYLLKVMNDDIELPDIEDIGIYGVCYAPYGSDDAEYKVYSRYDNPFKEVRTRYAVKPKELVESDEGLTLEEKELKLDDLQIYQLEYYDKKDDAITAVNNGGEWVGFLFELRDGLETEEVYRVIFSVPIKIKKSAKIGYVYPAFNEAIRYRMSIEGSDEGMTLKHGVLQSLNKRDDELDQLNQRIKTAYNNIIQNYNGILHYCRYYVNNNVDGMSFRYSKSEYENGEVVKGHISPINNGSRAGYFGGNSLNIVNAYAMLEKGIDQTDANGNPRAVFNLNAGQSVIDYRLNPAYIFPINYYLENQIDTLIIKDTLGKGQKYINGSSIQGGSYDSTTESVIGGKSFEPEITVVNGCQVLTWKLENVKAGSFIEPIRYSCLIEMEDMENGALIESTAQITASGDTRPITKKEGKVSSVSVKVVRNRGAALDKELDKEYSELKDRVKYKMSFVNTGSTTYQDVLIRDIFPYVGDKRGTDFKGGTYKVTGIFVQDLTEESIYVSKTDPKKLALIPLKTMYEETDTWNNWVRYTDEITLDDITAIAWRGDVISGQEVSIEVEMEINCPETRAVFANNVEAYTSNHQKLTSLKVCATVLPRKVSGITWFDADRDGIREAGEDLLAGVKVTLLDAEGNAVNDIYGKPVHSFVTGADGVYAFDNLAAGEYQVRFESDTYKLDDLLITMKDLVTATDEMDSDADGIYEGEILKAAVISGIELPELSEIVEKNLDEWHEAHLDAGFYNPESEEPDDPSDPGDPSNPSNPSDPGDPSDPSNPSDPGDPSDPSDPSNPGDPGEPDTPDEPEEEPGGVLGAYDAKKREPKSETEESIPTAVLGATDFLEILDDMIPLAVLPATGDGSWIWFVMAICSALGLAFTSLIDRKRK